MERYTISPDDCLILLAVKESSSLREGARQLGCDPAGLLRKVQRLAQEHGLLQKVKGRWTLTSAALALVAWTQESIQSQKKALRGEEVFRVASTAWFAERVLIPAVPRLNEVFERQVEARFSTPGGDFERALMEGDCDYVVVCHPPENPAIAHKRLLSEPWSVVVAPGNARGARKPASLHGLRGEPYVRHSDAAPSSLFPGELPFEILSSIMIDNLVGIRSAVQNGLGWSFVPTALVGDELASGALLQVGSRYELGRNICLWWLRGSQHGRKALGPFAAWVREACQRI